ncbi:MAG: hypothetical protein K2H87_00145, partial [Duncaniella sp.]|nr:hypothetical protein [Duncaniella sp.]
MRTILTRIFSTFLAGAATLSVAAAPQLAGKVNAGAQNRPSVAAKAVSDKTSTLLEGLKTRTIRTSSATFRTALSGAQYMPTKINVPMKAAGDVPTNMYGSIVYSDLFTQESQVGLYTIPATADGNSELIYSGIVAGYGGVEVEGIYYTSYYDDSYSWLGLIFSGVYGYDMETGEKVFSYATNGEDLSCLFPGGVTYDATTGNVYAISYTAAGNGYQFAKVEFGDNTMTVTPIAAINENFNSLAAAPDGTIYGISYVKGTKSTLVKFDKNAGTYTEVGVTGMLPNYLSSAAIDPKTGRMFWNVCAADETGTLCEVDLTTGKATLIYQFPGNDEVMGLTIPAPEAEDKAPAVAE